MQAARAAGVTAVLIGDAAHDGGVELPAPISISLPCPYPLGRHRTWRLPARATAARLHPVRRAVVPRPSGTPLRQTRDNKKDHSPWPTRKSQNVQDVFLNHVRKNKTPVTVFLVNGVKLQGIITWFDNFSVLLRRDGHTQLVYKHAISTVMPGAPIQLFDAAKAEGTRHA